MKSPIWLLVRVVLFILFLIVWYVTTPRGSSINWEVSLTDNRIVDNSTVAVKELWAVAGTHPNNFRERNLLVSTSGHLIVADTFCDRIMAVRFQTGAVIWQKEEILRPDNITLDEVRQRIYVSAPQNILALSVGDGEKIWSNVSDHLIRNAHIVMVDNDGQLTVEANGDWSISPDTGELSPVEVSQDYANSAPTPADMMRRYLSTVGSPSIASNVVTSSDIIYALDEHAQLHFISSADGRVLGTVAFEPPAPTRLLYEPGAIGGSWMAVEGGLVAIYFQDTNILATYEIDVPQRNTDSDA